jgi:murein DD-endopeptidase MepM/ murein hydrolase activator NlpD
MKPLAVVLALMVATVSFSINALQFEGVWQPGAMIIGQTQPNAVVYFQGERIALNQQGRFVVGLGRDIQGIVELKVVTDEREQVFNYPVLEREYEIQRVDGVPQDTVTPPEKVLARIRKETALVKKARADSDLRNDFLEGFIKPLEGPITGVYGSQRIYNGVPKRPHYGLDIARPAGTLVQVPASGIVKLAHDDMYFSGGTLIIDHGYGISSTFIHLSEILVEQGQRVERGESVARVGAGGRATGPHLDWRVNWFNVRLDPALVLKYFPAPDAAL